MAHRTWGIALVEQSYLYTAEASFHRMTQHGSPRSPEVLGQVIDFRPRRRVQAGIGADASAWPAGMLLG